MNANLKFREHIKKLNVKIKRLVEKEEKMEKYINELEEKDKKSEIYINKLEDTIKKQTESRSNETFSNKKQKHVKKKSPIETNQQTLRGPAFRRLIDQMSSEDDGEPSRFNYLDGVTNKQPLIDMRTRNNEFFNREEMAVEMNQRLDQLCTEDEIDKEVMRARSLSQKTADSKRKSPAERASAIQQIKQKNRLHVRFLVNHIRESALIEKYGTSSQL